MRWLDHKIDRFMDENRDLVEAVRVTNTQDALALRALMVAVIEELQEMHETLLENHEVLSEILEELKAP